MHNGVLALPIREEATSIVSADDQAAIVTSRYSEEVEVYATEIVRAVKSWLERIGLTLADAKMEAGLITTRKKMNTVEVGVGGSTVVFSVLRASFFISPVCRPITICSCNRSEDR